MASLQPFDKAPTLSSPTTLTHPSGVFISQLKQLRAWLIVALIIRHYPVLCLIYRSFYSVSDYTVPLSGYILFIILVRLGYGMAGSSYHFCGRGRTLSHNLAVIPSFVPILFSLLEDIRLCPVFRHTSLAMFPI